MRSSTSARSATGRCRRRRRGTPRSGPPPRRREPAVRRLMVEYGEELLGRRAGTPSTRRSAATRSGRCPRCTSRPRRWARCCSPRPGRSRAPSAAPMRRVLGFALVYLGEHYVVDLLARARADARGAPLRAIAARPVRAAGALVDRVARFAARRSTSSPALTGALERSAPGRAPAPGARRCPARSRTCGRPSSVILYKMKY